MYVRFTDGRCGFEFDAREKEKREKAVRSEKGDFRETRRDVL